MTDTLERREAMPFRTLVEEMLGNLKHCSLNSGCCHCGDSMDKHAEPMSCGHTPVDMGWTAAQGWIAKAEAALTTSPRVDEGRALRREGIVAFSADIENPRVLKLHFDQDVTSAHRALILEAINARRATLAKLDRSA